MLGVRFSMAEIKGSFGPQVLVGSMVEFKKGTRRKDRNNAAGNTQSLVRMRRLDMRVDVQLKIGLRWKPPAHFIRSEHPWLHLASGAHFTQPMSPTTDWLNRPVVHWWH